MSGFRSPKYNKEEEELATIAKAISHPARISILKILAKYNACYCGDIVEELPLAQATVSQHLKELKSAKLILGKIEPPKVCYCLNPKYLGKARQLFNEFFKSFDYEQEK